MKKILLPIIACVALLLVGCGKDDSTVAADTANTSETISAENIEEKYIECIENYTIDVKTDYSDGGLSNITRSVYMKNPEIVEITDDKVSAKGYLTCDTHTSSDIYEITYTIQEQGDIVNIVSANAPRENILIKPAVALDGTALYGITNLIHICPTEDTDEDITYTPENFPSVELNEDSLVDDYTYKGQITFIDWEGNKWVSEERTIKYGGIDGEYKWRDEYMVIYAYPAE